MKNAWRSPGVGVALLILLTVAAYLPVMHAGFIWDDGALITDNPMVKANDGLYRFWFTTEAPDYYPLTWSLWWAEWRLWGANARGYHAVNVLLHAINSVLVWMILRRLKIPGAWLAALVFAVHPVNVATVAWISEQKNTLSMLFYGLTILLYLKFDEEGRWRWYCLSMVAFVAGLLGKSAVVMLPVVLLGCVWWVHGRVQWKDLWRNGPFLILSLVFGWVTIWFQYNRALGGQPVRTERFLSCLAAAGWIPWFYLYKALLPLDLMVIYPRWQIDGARWISYVPGIILAGGFAFLWWKRNVWGRPLLFGFGYFVAMLFPVLGFFDQHFYRLSLVADHWQYYSIIAPITLVVIAGEWIGRRLGGQGRQWGTALGVAVLIVLGVATWTRAGVYVDAETLWRDNVARNPDAYMAYNNLGILLAQTGRLEEAIELLEQTLHRGPHVFETHYNLGGALAAAGRTREAIQQFEQALHLKPDDAEAHNNLANTLLQAGRAAEAVAHYEQALRLKPDLAQTHYNLGVALEQMGRIEAAIGHYEQALRINPDYAEARNSLAQLRTAH